MSCHENYCNEILLSYPEIRGTIQPIRNLLFYLEARWTEISSRSVSEKEPQFNSGVAYFKHEDIELSEVTSIFRYLARTFGREDLLGLTPQSRACVNQFLFKFPEIRVKLMKMISQTALEFSKNQENSEAIKIDMVKNFIEIQCPMVKNFLLKFMKNRGWVMDYMTIADFFFYEICFYLSNFAGSVLRNHAIYRNIIEFKNFFERQAFFQENVKSINSKKIFPPFRNQKAFQAIESLWEGEKQVIC